MLSRRILIAVTRFGARSNSTTSSPPPLLSKLRTDLKNSMKAKDTNRLNVLRSVLAEITNASKTQSGPPSTDVQIVSIIQKIRTKSVSSLEECKAAGRGELVAKEEGQIRVLDELVGEVQIVGKSEIEAVVKAVVEESDKGEGGKVNMGNIMKEVVRRFEGKNVVKADVAGVVKGVLGK